MCCSLDLYFFNFDSIISTCVPFQFLIYTSVAIKVEVYFWHSCTFVCVMKMSIAVPYYTLIQVKQSRCKVCHVRRRVCNNKEEKFSQPSFRYNKQGLGQTEIQIYRNFRVNILGVYFVLLTFFASYTNICSLSLSLSLSLSF